jgi:peptidoglycan/LPS O-acetylase OafA/YrhL
MESIPAWQQPRSRPIAVTGQSGRLLSIDMLRGVAALAVVFYHIHYHNPVSQLQTLLFFPFDFGHLGVTLFLVISGFCIHLGVAKRIATGQEAKARWGPFWKRRFCRLYPPYLAAIGVSLAVYYSLPGDKSNYGGTTFLPGDLLTHVALIHNLFPAYNLGLGNGPFWSLGLEEQLYALYALLLVLHRRWSVQAICLLALGLSIGWKLMLFASGLDRHTWGAEPFVIGNWQTWPLTYWFSWTLGAVAVEAYLGTTQLPCWCYRRSVALTLAVIAILTNKRTWGLLSPGVVPALLASMTSGVSELIFPMVGFIILNHCVRREAIAGCRSRSLRMLASVGLISYSLYLTHVPVLRVCENLLRLDHSLPEALLRFALFVPICVGVASAFFFGIERHFLHWPVRRSDPQGRGDAKQQSHQVMVKVTTETEAR